MAELKEAVVMLENSEDGVAEEARLASLDLADEVLSDIEVGLVLLPDESVEPEAVLEGEDDLRSDVTYVEVLDSEEVDR